MRVFEHTGTDTYRLLVFIHNFETLNFMIIEPGASQRWQHGKWQVQFSIHQRGSRAGIHILELNNYLLTVLNLYGGHKKRNQFFLLGKKN